MSNNSFDASVDEITQTIFDPLNERLDLNSSGRVFRPHKAKLFDYSKQPTDKPKRARDTRTLTEFIRDKRRTQLAFSDAPNNTDECPMGGMKHTCSGRARWCGC